VGTSLSSERPFGRRAQEQNREGGEPKVDNISLRKLGRDIFIVKYINNLKWKIMNTKYKVKSKKELRNAQGVDGLHLFGDSKYAPSLLMLLSSSQNSNLSLSFPTLDVSMDCNL
jgi:hypothetical protein